jgi:DNA-directed RNA polymerase subunit M/transcription elongation factor TFIIS
MKKSGFRITRPFGPQIPDVNSLVWLQRQSKAAVEGDVSTDEEEIASKKKKKIVSKFRPIDEIIKGDEEPTPDWANVTNEDSFEYTSLFCQACGSFLDLRQKSKNVTCHTCQNITQCKPGMVLMQAHAVVKYPVHKLWMEKLARSQVRADPGAQRAEVQEECPKCKNPRMFFWTQQLRSADEGQTVFYECGKCEHRYSINS